MYSSPVVSLLQNALASKTTASVKTVPTQDVAAQVVDLQGHVLDFI